MKMNNTKSRSLFIHWCDAIRLHGIKGTVMLCNDKAFAFMESNYLKTQYRASNDNEAKP